MSKKGKKKKGESEEASLPKFGGFQQMAGLKELKDRLEAEKKAANAKQEAPAKAPAPAKTRVPIPKASPEDELTFHRMMAGVVPLGGGPTRVPASSRTTAETTTVRTKAEEARARSEKETQEVLDHLSRLVDDPVRFEVTDDGVRVEGRRLDVPPSLVRQLRRGLLPIDGRLDLHGLSETEAHKALAAFLREKRTRGERCVLVIHGKGERVPGSGVLRGEISAWLSQGAAREHVAAFATASREDGGEGALYVALRR